MTNSNIPERIFYVWGADEPKRRDVNLCLLTWYQLLPDYEIIEINENSKKYFNFEEELNNNKWFRTVYENKLYAYISDYIRIKVLYENGGIYLDTDVSVLKPFGNILNNAAFVGIQNDSKTNPNIIEPAILGAQKGNFILKKILDFYENDIWNLPIYTMPQIFQYVLNKEYGQIEAPQKHEQQIIKLKDITIYPEAFFIPFRYGEEFNIKCLEENTYTIHWFGGSWVMDNVLYFMKNKHKQELNKLIKKCFSTHTYINNKFINISRLKNRINISCDFSFLLKFQHKYYNQTRYLTVFFLGKQIKLWKR